MAGVALLVGAVVGLSEATQTPQAAKLPTLAGRNTPGFEAKKWLAKPSHPSGPTTPAPEVRPPTFRVMEVKGSVITLDREVPAYGILQRRSRSAAWPNLRCVVQDGGLCLVQTKGSSKPDLAVGDIWAPISP